MTGYICHPRGWANHPVFGNIKRDPFDRRSAWNWLLEEAAYRPTETMFGGKKVTLKPGQLVSSIRHMGGRWGWTHTKVARFIRALQQCGLTVTATVTDATIITICDYEEIYGGRRVGDTPTDERPLQQRLATVPGSNKEEETKKERLPPTPLPGGESVDPNLPGIAPPESPPLPSPTKSRRTPRITAATAQVYDLDFETWYRAYPKRKGKEDACRAYRKARTTGVTRERLLASVQSYIVEMGGREQFIKHPATWLNKGCWDDEADKPAATDYTWGAPGFA